MDEQISRLLGVQKHHWHKGVRVPVEVYLYTNPGLQDNAEAVLDLIYGEIILREGLGESPQLEEFLGRFPRHAPALRRQMEVHFSMRQTLRAGKLSARK
jgi:hypothetical protein